MKNDIEYPQRAELHCHSVFSAMKGVASPESIFEAAMDLDITAAAITDTDSVGAFGQICRYLRDNPSCTVKPIMGAEIMIEGYSATLLVQNETGRSNLYRLLSVKDSTEKGVSYELLRKFHEGLLVGSGTSHGILYEKLRSGKKLQDDAAACFDYIEILPAELLAEDDGSLTEWQAKNRELVSFAEHNGLMAVAVTDAWCYSEQDGLSCNVLQSFCDDDSCSIGDFMLSTEEMLQSFDYLGETKAYRIVVLNSNLIADKCDVVAAETSEGFLPTEKDMDERLAEICMEKAGRIYEDSVYRVVEKRIQWELEAVKNTGMACIILMVKELMEKCDIQACDTSLRGTCGGSLLLYLCGISSFDPVIFGIAPYFAYGFGQKKRIDIILNVPSDMQKLMTDTLGSADSLEGAVHAGAPVNLSNTQIEYMIGAYEPKNVSLSEEEKDMVMAEMQNVKCRETAVQPGAMILIPEGRSIYDATPVTVSSDGETVTARYYPEFDHVFYKQDIMPDDNLRVLRDIRMKTGTDIEQIRLDDPDIIRLFSQPEALEGLPECSDPLVQEIMKILTVSSFDALVKVISLAHATGAWHGNAELMLTRGAVKLNEIISNRDDVFEYLVHHGMSIKDAFSIASHVGKGRGLTENEQQRMKYARVPYWYSSCCETIGYLYPRSQMVSYALVLWRLAYFKVHYPEFFKDS